MAQAEPPLERSPNERRLTPGCPAGRLPGFWAALPVATCGHHCQCLSMPRLKGVAYQSRTCVTGRSATGPPRWSGTPAPPGNCRATWHDRACDQQFRCGPSRRPRLSRPGPGSPRVPTPSVTPGSSSTPDGTSGSGRSRWALRHARRRWAGGWSAHRPRSTPAGPGRRWAWC